MKKIISCLSLGLTSVACAGNTVDVGPPGSGPDGGRFVAAESGTDRDPHCSADSLTIRDGDENVTTTCPAGTLCDNANCIDACQAAANAKTTAGCDFWMPIPMAAVSDPPSYGDGQGSIPGGNCLVAFLVNQGLAPVSLQIERDGVFFDPTIIGRIPEGGTDIRYDPLPGGQIPPNEVAILSLTGTVCPSQAATDLSAMITGSGVGGENGSGIGQAFHVSTSSPVGIVTVFPYPGGYSAVTGATTVLPTTVWDDEYIAVDPWAQSRITTQSLTGNWVQIVAQEDDTQITFIPKASILPGQGVPAAGPNVEQTYHLSRGQFVQVKTYTLPLDYDPFHLLPIGTETQFSGSLVSADKPIGVWGGTNCVNITEDYGACDSEHEQMRPVRALGSEYVAVPHSDRSPSVAESEPWRLVGAADGTELVFESTVPFGAATRLASGDNLIIAPPQPFVVRSQDSDHPFALMGYMTGTQKYFDGSDALGYPGDPEMVSVVPTAQFLNSYIFFTDPTYPTTEIVVVRAQNNGEFWDVTLDCAGALGGWAPVGAYEYTRLRLIDHNYQRQGNCDNGRHDIRSDAPFGLTVWGWGSAETNRNPDTESVSYAFTGGARVNALTDIRLLH